MIVFVGRANLLQDFKDHTERRKALAKNFTVAHLRRHFDDMVRDLCARTIEKVVIRGKRDGETDLLVCRTV